MICSVRIMRIRLGKELIKSSEYQAGSRNSVIINQFKFAWFIMEKGKRKTSHVEASIA